MKGKSTSKSAKRVTAVKKAGQSMAKTPAKKTAKVAKTAKKAKAAKVTKSPAKKAVSDDKVWRLRLYVAGQTPKSLTAFSNLKNLCEAHLPGQYEIEVVDLLREPQQAMVDQIVALPTLVRKLPEPVKRVIGDLSHTERVKIGLDLSFT